MYDYQGFFQSRTILWLLGALIAYAIKMVGLPMLPDDVSNEIVDMVSMILAAAIPAMIGAAMWFRVKATAIIEGLW